MSPEKQKLELRLEPRLEISQIFVGNTVLFSRYRTKIRVSHLRNFGLLMNTLQLYFRPDN
jgi:hypothetical protein